MSETITLERLEELKEKYEKFYYRNYKILTPNAQHKLLTSKDLLIMLIEECKTNKKIADPRW